MFTLNNIKKTAGEILKIKRRVSRWKGRPINSDADLYRIRTAEIKLNEAFDLILALQKNLER